MVMPFHLAAGPSMPTSVIGLSFGYSELGDRRFRLARHRGVLVISGIVIASSAEQRSAAGFARYRVLRLARSARR
jgi:hypothetical protein